MNGNFVSAALRTLCLVAFPGVATALDCEGIPAVPGDAVTLEVVSSSLDRPVGVMAPPGEVERIFVVEQVGRIRIIDLADDTLRPAPFLDIRSKLVCCGERGLLGLAFHPQFASNGYFYVNYTRAAGAVCAAAPPPGCAGDRAAETVVARYQVSSDPNVADPSSEKILLAFCQPFANHNAGYLEFGPNDGYLYIATGDGGSGADPCNSGQRTDTLLGKILRIDVDGEDAGLGYAIPPDNPFVGESGIRAEIWALGLRNPWRFSFDAGADDGTGKGDLYIADVGQGAWEEVDYRPASSAGGENYEWRRREGDHTFNAGTALSAGSATGPLYEYPHGGGVFRGCSITGGVVYRGCRMPDLRGAYFFADYCNNWVATFRVVDGSVADLRDRTAELNAGIAPDLVDDISSFGVDGAGEVYVCDLSTKLFRIVPASVPSGESFLRGDSNADGSLDVSDPVRTLLFLFAGAPPPSCMDAADADDQGEVDLSDAVYTLGHLFQGGPAPPTPGPLTCGPDASPGDEFDCASYPPCDD